MGLEVVRELASLGATVILATRGDAARLAAADADARHGLSPDVRIEVRHIDLANMASVRQFAKEVLAAHAQIDILVCNAGVSLNEYELSKDGVELHMVSAATGTAAGKGSID